MIYRAWLLTFCAALMCEWEETGQNPALFCYRIGSGACCGLMARARMQMPARKPVDFSTTRNRFECLRPSSTSFTHCSTPRD